MSEAGALGGPARLLEHAAGAVEAVAHRGQEELLLGSGEAGKKYGCDTPARRAIAFVEVPAEPAVRELDRGGGDHLVATFIGGQSAAHGS